jgi:hypothetical protein
MKWWVVMEVTRVAGVVRVHEIGGGWRVLAGDHRADAGRGKVRSGWIAAPSRSGANGGSLLPPAAMPTVRQTAAYQGHAVPASIVFVRYRECFRAPVRAMTLCCGPSPDPQSSQRDHARPVHTVSGGENPHVSGGGVRPHPNLMDARSGAGRA